MTGFPEHFAHAIRDGGVDFARRLAVVDTDWSAAVDHISNTAATMEERLATELSVMEERERFTFVATFHRAALEELLRIALAMREGGRA
jgi:hypothetical protein